MGKELVQKVHDTVSKLLRHIGYRYGHYLGARRVFKVEDQRKESIKTVRRQPRFILRVLHGKRFKMWITTDRM